MTLFKDQEAVLKDFIKWLRKLGINYMLTDSMAMIIYAMMPMTNNIDIVMEFSHYDADIIIREFESGY